MTDPWEDVRLLNHPPLASELQGLLDDADALLAVKEEVDNVLMMAHSFANFPSWLEKLNGKHAALPEHLKEEA